MIPISNSVIDVVFPARSSKLTLKGIVSPSMEQDLILRESCRNFCIRCTTLADPDNSSTASIGNERCDRDQTVSRQRRISARLWQCLKSLLQVRRNRVSRQWF